MNPVLLISVIAGVGVFLIVEALRPRHVRVRLTDEDQRPLLERLVDTMFAPITARIMSIGGRVDMDERRDTLERQLKRAGYPAPYTSSQAVLGYKLFNAVLYAAFLGLFALLTGWLGTAPILLIAGAVFGWGIPDRIIRSAEQNRREQLTLDAASTLDRLAIFVAAGNALPAAIISLTQRPGGLWIHFFRRVAAEYATSGDLPAALEKINEESGRLPEVTRVTDRLRAAHEMGGGGVATSLRRMAGDARMRIRLLITERGYRNAVLMVIPSFFAIVATMMVLMAPGALRMLFLLGQ